MSGVLVIGEHRRGVVADITFELISVALDLGAQGAGEIRVAVIGSDARGIAERCGSPGVADVIAVETGNAEFEPHVTQEVLSDLIDQLSPAIVLCGQTVDAYGYAPALAAKRGLGYAANVIDARFSDGELRARRAVYGDRLVAELAFDRPQSLLMVRPGIHPKAVPGTTQIRTVASDSAPVISHNGYREVVTDGIDITNADFLLSIGRGVGEEENVERFAELADKLGATLSASRPLVDAGWVASARQVGQSGRTVKPKVYVALGISGAAQHLAGIRDAETVVAINTDAEAPIFGVAKYGATVDLFDLADELESRL